MEKRPNILLIMADQFNANGLGTVQSQVKTPNLDQLSEEGVRWTHAYCNSPICGPSRNTFVTGQYPRTHGIFGNQLYALQDRNEHTMPAVFRRFGYQTAIVGHSHIVGQWAQEGFEHRRYCSLVDSDPNDPLDNDYFKYLHEQGLAHLFDLGKLRDGHPGSNLQAFDSWIPHRHSVETWTGDRTIEFLETRDQHRPFLMQMSFQRPHEPLSVPYDRGLLYDPASVALPDSAKDLFEHRFASKPELMKNHARSAGGYPYVPEDKEDLQRQLAYYYSLITLIDEQIGRVIEFLKQRGEFENTIIVFTSDHGDFAGEHGLMFKTLGIYESIHRIPFIIKYPGGPENKVIHEMVESVDLYPTLCELAGLPVPSCVEGESVVPVIRGEKKGKSHVFCECDFTYRYENKISAIRSCRYRLVYYGYGQEGELYDLQKDPDELNNVYQAPAYSGIRMELLERILDHVGKYKTKTTWKKDEEIEFQTRNGMTKLILKEGMNWNEIKSLYR